MKYVFAFEGQGAVKPLMGKIEYETNPVFREKLLHFAKVLDINIKDILWGSRRFELRKNIFYAHVALFATGLSLFYTLIERGITPCFIIGHSLGEIIGIIASEAISLEEGALLVKKRGELFEEVKKSNSSDMVALIGKPENIKQCLCEFEKQGIDSVYLANFNSPKQLVISVSKAEIPNILPLCTKHNVRYKLLEIGVGCHSPFVQSMNKELKEVIESLNIRLPKYPIYSTSFNEQLVDPEHIRERLIQHLLSPVKWNDSISALINSGYRKFIEVGFSKVLKGIILDIDNQVEVELAPNLLKK